MKILYIAPLPPPLTGQSLISEILLNELSIHHQVKVVNFSKNSLESGVLRFQRISEVISVLIRIWKYRKYGDVIYITISESILGNLKDLLTYLFIYKNNSKIVLHLHGGSLKSCVFDKSKLLLMFNKFFFKRMKGIIITGKSHLHTFENFHIETKIHIIYNFASSSFILTSSEIVDKFANIKPIRILYLSSLIPQKGYNDLVDAFLLLDTSLKEKISIHLAGGFDNKKDELIFMDKIEQIEQISYHGFVQENIKKKLLSDSHIFCLPSSYLEGQPISILEAYASGCVVLTTCPPGILDIFEPYVNGYPIKERSAVEIKKNLVELIKNQDKFLKIAIQNNLIAKEKYLKHNFILSIKTILEN